MNRETAFAGQTPRFTVWAPSADSVTLVTRDLEREMEAVAQTGYWSICPDRMPDDGRYAFKVNGKGPYADPRAPRLPDGVHGFSQLVDHEAHAWNDRRFRARPFASAVVYELHIGTFSDEGTFDSAIPHLPELSELRVTHLNVMPIASASGTRGWGYDGVGLFAPWEAYGGPEAFKRFVDACHEHDLAVILDVVYNHLGPEGNYLGQFGPYFTDRYHTPWGDALNLDGPQSDEVRAFILDNLEYWVRYYHVDGFRLDAVHALHDSSAVHILEAMTHRVGALERELGKPLVLIAESDLNDPSLVKSHDAGGYGLDAQWSDDFHHAVHCLLTGESSGYYAGFGGFEQLAKALTRVFVRDGHYAPHRGRSYGRPVGDTPRSRFVHCVQNHDQVGNRAFGERLSHLVSEGRTRVAAAVHILSPAVPMLFQGEEWACTAPFQYFTDHQDRDLARAVSEGRRNEFRDFGWDPEDVPDPQDEETFLRSKLRRFEQRLNAHERIRQWYIDLIRIRHDVPSFSCSMHTVPEVVYDAEAEWMLIFRGSCAVAFSLSRSVSPVIPVCRAPNSHRYGDATVGFTGLSDPDPKTVLLASDGVDFTDGILTMPPDALAVLGP